MANRRLEDVQREALDVRSRLFDKTWRMMRFDVNSRLIALTELIRQIRDKEIYRHTIVASIAALQTYFRGTIVAVTDSSDEYRSFAAESIPEKFTLKETLTWFSGKSATFGELVAHFSSCNSTNDVLSRLSKLLNLDLKEAMSKAVSEYDLRNNVSNPSLIVPDVNVLLADISEAFRLRHIFAHEAAAGVEITEKDCERMLKAVRTLLDAIDAVLWETVYKNHPLTQKEMNEHAFAEFRVARKELATVMREALKFTRENGTRAWLRANHKAWKSVTKDWYLNTYGSLQGTIWPSISGIKHAETIRSRVEQITNWVRCN